MVILKLERNFKWNDSISDILLVHKWQLGHNFALFWPPSTAMWTFLTLNGDKNRDFFGPPTTSSCPRSHWLPPTDDSKYIKKAGWSIFFMMEVVVYLRLFGNLGENILLFHQTSDHTQEPSMTTLESGINVHPWINVAPWKIWQKE